MRSSGSFAAAGRIDDQRADERASTLPNRNASAGYPGAAEIGVGAGLSSCETQVSRGAGCDLDERVRIAGARHRAVEAHGRTRNRVSHAHPDLRAFGNSDQRTGNLRRLAFFRKRLNGPRGVGSALAFRPPAGLLGDEAQGQHSILQDTGRVAVVVGGRHRQGRCDVGSRAIGGGAAARGDGADGEK